MRSAGALIGRDAETAVLEASLSRLPAGGGAALLLRGPAGIGKSALLAAAARRAVEIGFRVLRTAGVQSESHLPFAALQHLLGGLLAELPDGARPVVRAALGQTGPPGLPCARIALAVLDLLADVATAAPVVVLVDDAPWLDHASAEVLAFVGRRLAGERVLLLAAGRRDLGATPLCTAGLDELAVEPLAPAHASALLDSHAPRLPRAVRVRVLAEAAGNPLALVELPRGIGTGSGPGSASAAGWLPLTERLERTFADRVPGLPPAARTLLLLAALDDGDALVEVLAAGTLLFGRPATVGDLAPATTAGLLVVGEDGRLGFRHPLVRSAVRQAAPVADRLAGHRALAEVVAAVPGGSRQRAVWHRAAAAVGPDEEVAAALVAAAGEARARGAGATEEVAWARAAELTPDPAMRGVRLLRAAFLAAESGRAERTAELLLDAEPLPLPPADRLQLRWLREVFVDGTWSGADSVRAFVDLAGSMAAEGESDRALDALLLVALRSHWTALPQPVRDRLVAVARAAAGTARDPRLVAVLALADPVRSGPAVLDAVTSPDPAVDGDADALRLLGEAASAIGAFDAALPLDLRAEGLLRAQGRLGLLAQQRVHTAWAGVVLGLPATALPAADEAARLAEETGQPRWAAVARLATAAIAATRGDTGRAEELAAAAERVLVPSAATPMLALARLVRGRAALTAGRHREALDQLLAVTDPASPTYQPFTRWWAVDDLVDAAVHSGRTDAVRPLLAELAEVQATARSPLLAVSLAYADALLRDDDAGFAAALAVDTSAWPFARGRLLLGQGASLRRRRRVVDSRGPLRAALEVFEALSLTAWADRARQELRASGSGSGHRRPGSVDRLTAQELQIAQLAADGLTNREIGARLYLSHRTVGAHLYRIFPKLGISSRAELRVALDSGAPGRDRTAGP